MLCTEEALEVMSYFSNGIPLMMQQIADSIFWLNHQINSTITEQLAEEGIKDAAKQIASKQMRPILTKITKKEYHDMLIKITRLDDEFKKSHLKPYLNDKEKELFDVFLSDMVSLKILTNINDDDKTFKISNRFFYTIYE